MFKNFAIYSVFSALQLGSVFANESAVIEFEKAWNNPAYIQYQPQNDDINELLSHTPQHTNVKLSGSQLWEAQKRKAADPLKYIPHVAIRGITFNHQQLSANETTFMRLSQQRSWKDATIVVNVLEEVHLFENERKALFLGRMLDKLPAEIEMSATPYQDLFHVEHSIGGSEENPQNVWKIVFLSDGLNYQEVIANLEKSKSRNALPIFVEKFIEIEGNL